MRLANIENRVRIKCSFEQKNLLLLLLLSSWYLGNKEWKRKAQTRNVNIDLRVSLWLFSSNLETVQPQQGMLFDFLIYW